MKNCFYGGFFKDGLMDPMPFRPIMHNLTEEDYDMLARKFSCRCSYHTVISCSEDSDPWANALKKYETKMGHYALAAALYVSSGQRIRKYLTRLKANMDRGVIRESPVKGIAIFRMNSSAKVPTDCNHFFVFNSDFDDFGNY